MIDNKATILGVSINSSSTSSLLRKISETASNGKSEVRSEKLDSEMGSEKLLKSHVPFQSPASNIQLRTSNKKPLIVFTPNPEFLVEANGDKDFHDLLNKSDINMPDGIGLVWAGKFLGQSIRERVSGADVVERLLEVGNRKWEVGREVGVGSGNEKHGKWVVGVAGARRGVQSEAEELIKRLGEKYQNIKFVNLDLDVRSEKWEAGKEMGNGKSLKSHISLQCPASHFQFHTSKSFFNIVFAAHGMKKQENWIWENKDKFNANVMMGVGGSLDFLTGFSKRAPKIIQSIGLEWLWRGLHKPSHFKRIWKATILFGWLVLKQVLGDSG